MRILKIFFNVSFLFTYLSLYSVTYYVSLGYNCEVATMLRNYNLRSAAYPFDWIGSDNFYGIINAINDDFKYFLDPFFLEYKNQFILNTYYGFGYNHFFPIIGHAANADEDVWMAGTVVPNYLDYLPAIQATQGRRIARLIKILSSNDKVIFIRTQSNPDEARDFMNMIKIKYPFLNAHLVVVHEKTDIRGDWGIPNVVNFCLNPRSAPGVSWSGQEWASIFHQIQNY